MRAEIPPEVLLRAQGDAGNCSCGLLAWEEAVLQRTHIPVCRSHHCVFIFSVLKMDQRGCAQQINC